MTLNIKKIYGIFFLTIVAPAVLVGAAAVYITSNSLSHNTDKLSQSQRFQTQVQKLWSNLLIQEERSKQLLLNPESYPELSGKKIAAYDDHKRILRQLEESANTVEIKRLVQAIKAYDDETFRPLDTEVLELLFTDPQEARALYYDEYSRARYKYDHMIESLAKLADAQVTLTTKLIEETNRDTIFLISALLLSGGFVAVIVFMWLSSIINKNQIDLHRANKLLEETADSKARFLANMSHEIRTPLNGVIGATELLVDTELDKGQEELLGVIQQCARTTLSVINDVLDVSKLNADGVQLEVREFSFKKLVKNSINILEPALHGKGIFCNNVKADDFPNLIAADEARLQQIILNLLSNAIKFTETGGVTIKYGLDKEAEDSPLLNLQIKDTGIGIAADKLHTLFDEFTQAEASTTRNFGGTGLGLSICKKLVNLMGGEITIVSTLGIGTTFTVKIPVQLVQENPVPQAEVATELPVITLDDYKKLRVLVAEDNEVNQMVLKSMLAKIGVEPMIVENGQIALQHAQKNPYDIIFLDWHMPVMDGLTAARLIREAKIEHRPYLIAFTASAEARHDKDMQQYMDEFLEKPVTRKKLVGKLDTYFNKAAKAG